VEAVRRKMTTLQWDDVHIHSNIPSQESLSRTDQLLALLSVQAIKLAEAHLDQNTGDVSQDRWFDLCQSAIKEAVSEALQAIRTQIQKNT
jgi:DNA polymerase III delta subunit